MTLSHPLAPTQPVAPDSPTLLSQVRMGDMDALGVLYREYAGELLALAARLTGSRSDADDVVQDVFVGLPRALARYDERGRLLPWLRRLTVRGALIRLRSGRRRRETELDDVESFWVSDTTEDASLRDAMDRLDAEDRTIIVLKVFEGYSHGEIAELLGIRRGTSEVRLHRAMERLRQQLTEGS